jgi:hypothetical protein
MLVPSSILWGINVDDRTLDAAADAARRAGTPLVLWLRRAILLEALKQRLMPSGTGAAHPNEGEAVQSRPDAPGGLAWWSLDVDDMARRTVEGSRAGQKERDSGESEVAIPAVEALVTERMPWTKADGRGKTDAGHPRTPEVQTRPKEPFPTSGTAQTEALQRRLTVVAESTDRDSRPRLGSTAAARADRSDECGPQTDAFVAGRSALQSTPSDAIENMNRGKINRPPVASTAVADGHSADDASANALPGAEVVGISQTNQNDLALRLDEMVQRLAKVLDAMGDRFDDFSRLEVLLERACGSIEGGLRANAEAEDARSDEVASTFSAVRAALADGIDRLADLIKGEGPFRAMSANLDDRLRTLGRGIEDVQRTISGDNEQPHVARFGTKTDRAISAMAEELRAGTAAEKASSAQIVAALTEIQERIVALSDRSWGIARAVFREEMANLQALVECRSLTPLAGHIDKRMDQIAAAIETVRETTSGGEHAPLLSVANELEDPIEDLASDHARVETQEDAVDFNPKTLSRPEGSHGSSRTASIAAASKAATDDVQRPTMIGGTKVDALHFDFDRITGQRREPIHDARPRFQSDAVAAPLLDTPELSAHMPFVAPATSHQPLTPGDFRTVARFVDIYQGALGVFSVRTQNQ